MSTFEWEARFIVEGVLPANLPQRICDKFVLEKRKKDKSEAILSVKITRSHVPSQQEFSEVRAFAHREATKFTNAYSVFIGQLKFRELSIDQITPYKGERFRSMTVPLRGELVISEEDWKENKIAFEEILETPSRRFVSLAMAHYHLALWTEPKSSFLNLMICMEALFNDSPQELRYRISHRVANLFGKTEGKRARIFNDIQALYKKRNDIVHGLRPVKISREEKSLLQIYSKHSIAAFLKLQKKKKNILRKVDEAQYNESLREKTQSKIQEIIESLEEQVASLEVKQTQNSAQKQN